LPQFKNVKYPFTGRSPGHGESLSWTRKKAALAPKVGSPNRRNAVLNWEESRSRPGGWPPCTQKVMMHWVALYFPCFLLWYPFTGRLPWPGGTLSWIRRKADLHQEWGWSGSSVASSAFVREQIPSVNRYNVKKPIL
jgi:hypothetical protein